MPNKFTIAQWRGDLIPDEYWPKPAKDFIPDWYKSLEGYINSNRGGEPDPRALTIKKCMPVFDSITAGYILQTWCDIYVERKGDDIILFPSSYLMEFENHNAVQAPNHPKRNDNLAFFKFNNPFGIITPKGYSSLFTTPFHRDNPYFDVLDGIVDTDSYHEVNIVFSIKSSFQEGIIPAGTPIVQIIPFKREGWKLVKGSNIDIIQRKAIEVRTKWVHYYRNKFWSRKSFN